MPNPNSNRGPWCVIDQTEMNRPNHRFQARTEDDGSLTVRRFHGELLPGFDPVCGENCLSKYVAQWAQGSAIPVESSAALGH